MEKGRARAAKRRKLKLGYRASKYAYIVVRPSTVYVTVNRERVSLNEVLKLQFYRE